MQYRKITADDAAYLTEIFSIPEYEMYFAENETTEEGWRDRITRYYGSAESLIVTDEGRKIGWVMYEVEGDTCSIDIIVLHPEERFKGYGKTILSDILQLNPLVKEIKLDVQQRNKTALAFYKNLGFVVDGEEIQPVGDTEVPYYKISLSL